MCFVAAEVVRGVSLPLLLRVFPLCSLCPLFDAERAVRDMLGENALPPLVLEITYGPKLRALLRGDLDSLTQESEQRAKAFSVRVPVQTLDMISAFREEPLPTVVTLAGPRASLSAKRRRTPEAEAC